MPYRECTADNFRIFLCTQPLIYSQQKIMQDLDFPLGRYYHIIAGEGAGQRALAIETNDRRHFDKARILGAQPDPNDPTQLFMVEKTGLEDDSWQIVNCISSLVFDQESGQIRLKKGKRVADQLFKLQKFRGDQCWIKCDDDDKRAVCLQGIIRYKQFNNNDRAQLFRFVPVKNDVVERSSIIINDYSGKALDVPFSSFELDTRIIQFTLNMRFNQRWLFIRKGNGFVIQNLLNGLALDIANESKEGGSPVIQWSITGSSNQIWRLEPSSKYGCYKIASLHAPGMYLCIKNSSLDNFGKLQIWDKENPSMNWRIEGFVPS